MSVALHLVRHTPVATGPKVCIGRTDVALAPGWRSDVEAALAKLAPAVRAAAPVRSSPLERCRRLARALGRPVLEDERLREMDFGAWEGRPWDAIPRAEIDAWNADLVGHAPPGGEPLGAVVARVRAWLEEAALGPPGPVVAVTHGGVIRCALAHALGLAPECVFRLHVDYGSLSVVEHGRRGWRVVCINR